MSQAISNRVAPKLGIVGIIVAMGIVYGDIGTSPLYVMKAVAHGLPLLSPDYIIGAVSCVIWTLTLQTTLKYVVITLRADNNGEGGILSLFALIRRKYRRAYVFAAIGAATLLADGIITPSITVTSAIEGVNVVFSSIPIVPVVIVIVIALFLMQPYGTGSLGKVFGVVMLGWFLMLGTLGFVNLIDFPGILKAFNPYYAVNLLINAPNTLIILGAVFLCTTGAEALYTDLGHCGLKNIRISWIFVKTMLLLNYLGQGAWMINNASALHGTSFNPFFAIMPEWFAIFGVVMATLAAIIASQSMISGSFSIISEAVSLNLWPNIKIKYPTEFRGQMFVPSINYLMMALCIVVVLLFRSSSNMEAAYGLAITITMLMTSTLLIFYFKVKKVSPWRFMPMIACFMTIEIFLLVANSVKFAHGGYMTIIIAGMVFAMMWIWQNGVRIKNRCVKYGKIGSVLPIIDRVSEDDSIPKFATHLVYVTRAKYKEDIESKIIYSLVHMQPKRADTYWFVYFSRSDEPYQFTYEYMALIPGKAFRIDIRAGFKMGAHIDTYFHKITDQMEADGVVDLTSRYPSMSGLGMRGDFRFVVVERVLLWGSSVVLGFYKRTVLSIYQAVKRFTTSDTQILDLDPSNVTVEKVPLLALSKIDYLYGESVK